MMRGFSLLGEFIIRGSIPQRIHTATADWQAVQELCIQIFSGVKIFFKTLQRSPLHVNLLFMEQVSVSRHVSAEPLVGVCTCV